LKWGARIPHQEEGQKLPSLIIPRVSDASRHLEKTKLRANSRMEWRRKEVHREKKCGKEGGKKKLIVGKE